MASIEIKCPEYIHSVAFLPDGKHVVSSGYDGKIRRWRVKDGKEVGTPMNSKSPTCDIAVSRDWIVSGTKDGSVAVRNAQSHQVAIEFTGHSPKMVTLVDISPDGSKIVTGSEDCTICIWSRSTGQRLFGPWKHGGSLAAVKFSPNGHFVATSSSSGGVGPQARIRVYDGRIGGLVSELLIAAIPSGLTWDQNSNTLFLLDAFQAVHSIDVSTGTSLVRRSNLPAYDYHTTRCITMSSNDKFVLITGHSLVTFWDTTTWERIATPPVHHTAAGRASTVECMSISASFDLVLCGGNGITLFNLSAILPSGYVDDKISSNLGPTSQKTMQPLHDKNAHLENTGLATFVLAAVRDKDERIKNTCTKIEELQRTHQQLSAQLADCRREADRLLRTLRTRERKQKCEVLYAEGRINDALASVFEFSTTLSEEDQADKAMMEWLYEFPSRCMKMLEMETCVRRQSDFT